MVAPSFPRLRDRALLALLLPVVGPLIEKQYGATPAAADRAETLILDSFDRISAHLAHQPYLSGARFGASDLSFVDKLRATKAGQHAGAHPGDDLPRFLHGEDGGLAIRGGATNSLKVLG